jgi:hypothetical protein
MGAQQQQVPQAPSPSEEYKRGLKIYLKYLPKTLRREFAARQQWDPRYIEQQQALQAQYGPSMYRQQLAALQQIDPQGVAMRRALGNQIAANLASPFIDPLQRAGYGVLGRETTGQAARGATFDPESLRQISQSIRSRQGSLSGGRAAEMAEAVGVGLRGEQLRAQREQALGGFLGIQSPEERARQLALAQAGSFLSSPTPEQRIAQIQGVQVPSASRYVNPQAGYMGQQFALQNYQNQLGQYQAQGAVQNPWSAALGTVGSVAGGAIGSYYGGPVGGAAGSTAGGYAGSTLGSYFSDVALKENISRTGLTTKDGIPIVTFNFKGLPKTCLRGVLAQDVIKIRPDAVDDTGGYLRVNYTKLGLRLEEI